MSLFNWSHTSIKHKIGGLFIVLLSFLFFVIVYSGYKIQAIEKEMREVAYLDIPLSKIITQVEFIELEQHLMYEQFKQGALESNAPLKRHQQIAFQKRSIKTLLDRAVNLIEDSITSKQLVLNKDAHIQALEAIKQYEQESLEFEKLLDQVISSSDIDTAQQEQVEQLASRLENAGHAIIHQLNQISTQDAYYTEKHEQEFLLINLLLGISALVLGLFLTVYITRIILTRIRRIQKDVKTLNNVLDSPVTTNADNDNLQTKDELAELEMDVKSVMSRLNHEISSREKMEQHLLALATQDKLTGAFNRHKWNEQIEVQLNLAQRGNYQFGLLLLDIDHFKQVNDNYGHLVGDNLLQLLVKIIKERIRSTDMLFRIGGEEFAVILPMQEPNSAYSVAEDLRRQIEKQRIEGLPQFTVSIGIAHYLFNDTEESIFNRADNALYKAKSEGRNRVVEAPSVDD